MKDKTAAIGALSCEQCLLRQYDADCREDQLALPADVAAHLAQCPACQSEWQEQQQFDAQVKRSLLQLPPAAAYRRALTAIVQSAPEPSFNAQVFRELSQAFVLGAIATAMLAGASSGSAHPVLLACAFASGVVLNYLPLLWRDDEAILS